MRERMRYQLFAGNCYYAAGGGHDYQGSAKTVDDLVASSVLIDSDGFESFGWWHVFDIETRQIVCGSKQQAHGNCDLPDDKCRSLV